MRRRGESPSLYEPARVEPCRCGCHGAQPRPQFAPTPAAYRQMDAELGRLQTLAKKLARCLFDVLDSDYAHGCAKGFFRSGQLDAELQAALDEIMKERAG